jgi:GntR family transcriptional regulator / MocR family aminotransferase
VALLQSPVVTAFEQLGAEGFLQSRVGAGTWVRELPAARRSGKPGPEIRVLPSPLQGLSFVWPARPFRCHEPALGEFPIKTWARLWSRRLRRASPSSLAERDPRGHKPLREALADYLAAARSVKCIPEQIVIVSGVQQALDLLARVLVKPGEQVWIEDPGYFGAVSAFRNAGASVVPVPVDEQGLSVRAGRRIAPHAKAAYLTPAHQFPLGALMSVERRLEVLSWAREAGAFLIEDDYDGEYRFQGRPVPALQSLDRDNSVIFVGGFNKLLFSSLRVGYMVLAPPLVDPILRFRFDLDQNSVGFEQSVLCDFIAEGHMSRHIRRMRDLYAERLAVLREESRRRLGGLVEIPAIKAGLFTVGYLRNGISSSLAEAAAAKYGVETMGLHRFTLRRSDPGGLLLGFAAFDETQIRRAVATLQAALHHASKSLSQDHGDYREEVAV